MHPRYAEDQDQVGDVVGICSKCSGSCENDKVGEVRTDTEQNEVIAKQGIKCEEEEEDIGSLENMPSDFIKTCDEDDHEDTYEMLEDSKAILDTSMNDDEDATKSEETNQGPTISQKTVVLL